MKNEILLGDQLPLSAGPQAELELKSEGITSCVCSIGCYIVDLIMKVLVVTYAIYWTEIISGYEIFSLFACFILLRCKILMLQFVLLLQRIIEINTRYQEKLSALRAQQANRREEFLRKESETRLHQYQQAGLSSHPNSGLQDVRGYGGTAVAVSAGEIHGYRTGSFESQGDRSHFTGGRRTQGSEVRVPYPEGRVYNTSSQYY